MANKGLIPIDTHPILANTREYITYLDNLGPLGGAYTVHVWLHMLTLSFVIDESRIAAHSFFRENLGGLVLD